MWKRLIMHESAMHAKDGINRVTESSARRKEFNHVTHTRPKKNVPRVQKGAEAVILDVKDGDEGLKETTEATSPQVANLKFGTGSALGVTAAEHHEEPCILSIVVGMQATDSQEVAFFFAKASKA